MILSILALLCLTLVLAGAHLYVEVRVAHATNRDLNKLAGLLGAWAGQVNSREDEIGARIAQLEATISNARTDQRIAADGVTAAVRLLGDINTKIDDVLRGDEVLPPEAFGPGNSALTRVASARAELRQLEEESLKLVVERSK